jgi:predicted nucleotidyltransferase
MNDLPSHLTENERAAIWEFANTVSRFLEADLIHLWLFGSKAHGNFTDESDLDLLVVLREMSSKRRGVIQRIAARISLDHDTLINTHMKDKTDWDEIVKYEDTLWREVKRDGICLDELIGQFENLPDRSLI